MIRMSEVVLPGHPDKFCDQVADAIVADTTRTRIDAGLISEEAAASSPYEFYVPLRGFAEEDLDPGNPSENQTRARSGKGFSVGGREDRTVTGRGRKAEMGVSASRAASIGRIGPWAERL